MDGGMSTESATLAALSESLTRSSFASFPMPTTQEEFGAPSRVPVVPRRPASRKVTFQSAECPTVRPPVFTINAQTRNGGEKGTVSSHFPIQSSLYGVGSTQVETLSLPLRAQSLGSHQPATPVDWSPIASLCANVVPPQDPNCSTAYTYWMESPVRLMITDNQGIRKNWDFASPVTAIARLHTSARNPSPTDVTVSVCERLLVCLEGGELVLISPNTVPTLGALGQARMDNLVTVAKNTYTAQRMQQRIRGTGPIVGNTSGHSSSSSSLPSDAIPHHALQGDVCHLAPVGFDEGDTLVAATGFCGKLIVNYSVS